MKPTRFAAIAAFGMLAACAQSSAPPASAPAAQPAAATQPAPPDVGFSPDVSDTLVNACRNELDAQTDGAVEVTGSEFSQANNAVYMVVGDNRAPWQCLGSNDGRIAELMFIGDEGAL